MNLPYKKKLLPICKSLILEDIDNLPHTPFTDRKRVMRVARMQIYLNNNYDAEAETRSN